jgi:hypothetical protein
MNNLLHLETDDFYLSDGAKGKILCLSVQGICLVLFHANPERCLHCEEAIPEFKKVSRMFSGCKFGLANLNKFPEIIRMSKLTISPLEYVPYMILYVNGRPFLRYEGERTAQDLSEFLQEVMVRLESKKQFIESKNYKVESEIPAYSIAIPFNMVCDEDKGVCYLTYGEIYKKAGQKN